MDSSHPSPFTTTLSPNLDGLNRDGENVRGCRIQSPRSSVITGLCSIYKTLDNPCNVLHTVIRVFWCSLKTISDVISEAKS